MSATQVYVKTPKGIEEMNSRSYGLSPRLRRLLIMVDGKRNSEELVAMFTDDDSNSMLDELLKNQFIVSLQASVTANTVDKSAPQVDAPVDEAQRFAMAKNLMVNTVKTFLGSMGSGLVNQLEKCESLEQLRPHYKAWRQAIEMTRDGRKQLAELEQRLAALLS